MLGLFIIHASYVIFLLITFLGHLFKVYIIVLISLPHKKLGRFSNIHLAISIIILYFLSTTCLLRGVRYRELPLYLYLAQQSLNSLLLYSPPLYDLSTLKSILFSTKTLISLNILNVRYLYLRR